LLLAGAAAAHVGSPDIFHEANAGPYPLFVTIRPPSVIPGVAEVEIRSTAKDIREIRIVPMPMSGPGARFAPTPDIAQRSKDDPQFFTGTLWMMATGSWQVKVTVDGERGEGRLAVPVPAVANRTAKMQFALGAGLLVMTLILAAGAISIVGASAREGQLEPGAAPAPAHRRRARILMAVTAGLVTLIIYFGNDWWTAEANNYSRLIFKPLEISASLDGGNRLVLRLRDPGWLRGREIDDFVPDHGHLMHMYVFRLPEMERAWHLHPERTEAAVLTQNLPPMPAGRYALYADVVHKTALPETLVTEVDLPEVAGSPLMGDDSAGVAAPLSAANFDGNTSPLSGGYRMVWEREPGPLKAKRPTWFRFRVEDAAGKPATDLQLYMGMPGHAAFVKSDRTVFAHVHPTGSVPMAALSIAEKDPHAGHTMEAQSLPAVVSFPYGLPQPGNYRIFVQVKRAGKVEMGVFDARAE
jgi:hypothetical protein